MKARMNNKEKSLRKFDSPVFQIDAKNYHELINWNTEITEPPLTSDFTDEEIVPYIYRNRGYSSPDIYSISLGTTSPSVERNIKKVSEA